MFALACAACSSELATTEQSATVCAAGPTVRGMDVAVYDDVADWAAARASGIEFAFVRVSDGLDFPDAKFDQYWPAAQAAGMVRGAYQYFEPAQDPIVQADLVLGKAVPEPGDLPPVLDLEVSGGLSHAQVVASVQAWVDHVAAAIGRPPIVYAGLYSWPDLTGGADFTSSPLWIPQYTSAPCPDIPDPWTRWQFWQNTASGSAPGVTSSDLDLDVFNGTHDDLVAFAGSAAPGSAIDPVGTAHATAVMPHATGGGCDAGRGTGWLMGLVVLVRRRRRT
jgi:lysozyme